MKRIFFAVMLVVMLSLATAVSYASASPEDYHRRRTPAPRPTATSVSGGLRAPTLLSPANNATLHAGNVTWSWTAVPGAARYHLQAGLNTAFDQQYNIIDQGSTTPSYTFNASPGFIFYFPHLYWRVQAIDANNVAGPWSEVWWVNLVSP